MSQQQDHERFYAGTDTSLNYSSDAREQLHIADKPGIFIDFRFLVALNSLILLIIPAIISIVMKFLINDLAMIGHAESSVMLLLFPLCLAGMLASLLYGWNKRVDLKFRNAFTRSGKITVHSEVPLAQRIILGVVSLILVVVSITQVSMYIFNMLVPITGIIALAIAVVLIWSAFWINRSFYRR